MCDAISYAALRCSNGVQNQKTTSGIAAMQPTQEA